MPSAPCDDIWWWLEELVGCRACRVVVEVGGRVWAGDEAPGVGILWCDGWRVCHGIVVWPSYGTPYVWDVVCHCTVPRYELQPSARHRGVPHSHGSIARRLIPVGLVVLA